MKKMSILSAAIFGLLMSAPVALADDITVSVVGPMTGQLATIGDQFKQGAQAAADAINAAGGVIGRRSSSTSKTTQCDPKQAVSVANRIVANGVKFIDGHACSGSSIPASAVYAESRRADDEPGVLEPGADRRGRQGRLANHHAALYA